MTQIIELKISELKLWERNPRPKELIPNESDSIKALFSNTVDIKNQKALAKDLLTFGPLPNDLPIVVKEDGNYVVYEGNRRISCIKSLNNPSLLDFDKSLEKSFSKLAEEHSDELANLQIISCIQVHKEYALKYVQRLHTSLPGINRVPWGPEEQEYFFDIVVDDPNQKKTHAYHIINSHKGSFKEEIIKNIKFTTMNRVLNYSVIKDFLGIKDYSTLTDIQIELINHYLDLCIISEERDNIRMSRFTVGHVRSNIMPDLRLKYNEILTRDESYYINYDKLVNINVGDEIDLSFEVKNKKTNEVVKYKDVVVEFFDKDNNIIEEIDSNLTGTYGFIISYDDTQKEGNIVIKKKSLPEISLKKHSISLQTEQTLDLRSILNESPGLIIEKVKITNKKNSSAILQDDLFTKDNLPGNYYILYSYKLSNGTITKTLLITVEQPVYDNLFSITADSIFSKQEIHTTNINPQINAIIHQMNNVDFDKYYLLVASGFRTIIELGLHKFFQQKNISLPVGLEKKINEFIGEVNGYINNGQFTTMCQSKNVSFNTYKNYVNTFDAQKVARLVSKLHLSTHSGGTMIPKDEILDLGRTDITELIILFNIVI